MKNSEVLRDEAYRLTEEIQQRSARPGATVLDRLIAETSGWVIAYADRKAKTVPAAPAAERLQALKDFARQRLRDLEAERTNAHSVDRCASLAAEVLRDVQDQKAAFLRWTERYTCSVWNEACEELTALRAERTLASDLHGHS